MPAAGALNSRSGDRECGEWVLATRGSGGVRCQSEPAIKWVASYRTTGSWAAKPRGGSTSPLEKHANFFADAD